MITHTAREPDGSAYYGFDDQTQNWVPLDEESYGKAKVALAPISAEAAAMAAEDVGMMEAALIGAGKATSDIVEGAKDLYYRLTGQEGARQALQTQQAAQEAIYDPLEQARPFATGLGESAPYMLGGGVAGVGKTLASALLRQGSMGAAIGGTEYAPTFEESAMGAGKEALLGIGGQALGRGLGRLVTPALEAAGEGIQRVLQEAAPLGFKALPSTYTESGTLRNVLEGGLETMPTSAHVLDTVRARNEDLLSTYAARAIGEQKETAVTDAVLDQAHRRIGGEFRDVVGKDTRYYLSRDDALLDRLETIEAEGISPYLVGAEDPVRNLVDRALDLMTKREGGEVTGREIYGNISRLGRAATNAMRNNNADLGLGLFDLQRALLDVIESQATPGNAARLREARQQWRNLVNIEGSVDPVSGTVRAQTLANRLQRTDRPGFMRGQNRDPFYTAVRFMARVQPPLKSSGTAERSALQQLIGNALSIAGPAGSIYSGASLLPGLGMAALPFAAPYAMAKYYTRPQAANWLLRQPLEGRFMGIPASQQGLLGMGGIGLTQMLGNQ